MDKEKQTRTKIPGCVGPTGALSEICTTGVGEEPGLAQGLQGWHVAPQAALLHQSCKVRSAEELWPCYRGVQTCSGTVLQCS